MEHIFLYKDGETEIQTTQGWVRGYQYDGISIFKAFRMHRQDDFKNRKKKKTGMECWMQQVMDMSAH